MITVVKNSISQTTIWLVSALLVSSTSMLWAADPPSLEEAAAQLQRTVVTLRVQPVVPRAASDGDKGADEKSVRRVTVCSGVLLGAGRIVTSAAPGGDCSIRVTMPGGAQAAARVRAVDEYSGLSLLEIEDRQVPGISCAEALPPPGAWVLSGAGWGADQPVISFGIVSGSEVAVPKTTFPPLLRCDLRVAQTSSGAAVTNAAGELIGVVVLAERAPERGGWMYAVPVSHVQRLMRAANESTNESSVLVLKRRRPIVGMVLDGDGEHVYVSRVREDSPASKAGIEVGDEILAAEAVRIRSVYQALRPVLRKQPGDRVVFLINRNGQQQTIPVVLGGGVELPSTPAYNLSKLVQPTIDLENLPEGGIRASSTIGEVREYGNEQPLTVGEESDPQATDAEKIALLEKALQRYRDVIARLNQRLEQSEVEREQAEKKVEALEVELKQLKSDRQP